MNEADIVAWMKDAVEKASRSAKFCCSGTLPPVDAGLVVEGVGPVKLPLKPKTARQLIDAGRVAPYGKGTKTIVDTKVRKAFELDPQKIELSDAFQAAIADTTRQVAQQLGLPDDQLQAQLYKLLIYERGGFFLPHRDSEKRGRMIASLVVVLPMPFGGGEIVVRHESAQQTLRCEEAAAGQAANFVAFYADCQHEVRRVMRGRRLCLTYNLTLKSPRKKKSNRSNNAPAAADVLAESIRGWMAANPAEPLVFALEHRYTDRGLKADLLKGADRQIARVVAAAAEKTNCRAQLAQISRHLMQFADDGSFGRGYWSYRQVPTSQLEISETYEDQLRADGFRDLKEKRLPLGEIPLDPSAVISSEPLDDWKPTSEEYEGYTGNAGNTLDRWYHRSAIVVWHDDHHWDIVARGGARASIELWLMMMSRLEKTPKKRLEQAREDCRRLARAIIRRWPQRSVHEYRFQRSDKRPWLGNFVKSLPEVEDERAIAELLSVVAERDKVLQLDKLILSACLRFDGNEFADQLTDLIEAPLGQFEQGLAPRDAQWLCAVCCDRKQAGIAPETLQDLCTQAARRFGERFASDRRIYHRGPESMPVESLPLLVKAFVAAGAENALTSLIATVRSHPDQFTLKDAQVSCLKKIIPWCRKRTGEVPGPLAAWLANVRNELESATAARPSPPTDWTRPADVNCTCRVCTELKQFLSDPAADETRIAARADLRDHLTAMIRHHQCDVRYKLERRGSPHRLHLTKTDGSYRRAVKDYEMNVKLLKSLHSLPG